MMAERALSTIVELDIDRCTRTFGVSPCTGGLKNAGTLIDANYIACSLAASAPTNDDAYNELYVRVISGPGAGQHRKIADYTGSTRTALLAKRFNPSNLLLRSSDFDHATWAKSGATVTANIYSPDAGIFNGTTDKLVESALNEVHEASQGSIPVVNGGAYLTSLYAHSSGRTKVRFNYATGGVFGTTNLPIFDLSNGTITDGTGVTTASVVYLGNGWYRLMIYAQATAAGNAQVYVTLMNGATTSYLGDGASGVLLANAQCERANEVGDYVGTADTRILLPDSTSTYAIVDLASACYNTFKTCVDKVNFNKGTHTYKFTELGAPLPGSDLVRPYVTKISMAPTEIDPEAGLARRGLVSLTLRDAADVDSDSDPYIDVRTVPAVGTFWSRFSARQNTYVGRLARVKRAYVNDGVFGTYVTELFMISSVRGPSNGEITLELKDRTAVTTTTQIPKPTNGKLASAITTVSTTLPLGSGEGAQYDTYGFPCHVRRGDEIIKIASRTTDTLNVDTGGRGQFGTTAAAGNSGDVVQLCKTWSAASFRTVVEDILNECGITDTYIDLTGIQTEDTNWLGAKYQITTCLSEPESADGLLGELCFQAGGVMWWSPTEQKVKFKVLGPSSPSDPVQKVLTDVDSIISGSMKLEVLDDLRISMSAMYYGLIKATAPLDEAPSYLTADLIIDVDAESVNEYNERRSEVTYSRWFGTVNLAAMKAWTQRRVAQYRTPPTRVSFKLDPKDVAVKEGQLYDIETRDLTDFRGNILRTRVLILKRKDNGRDLEITARTTSYGTVKRYGYIAPNSTPAYPNNNGYACVCLNSGLFSDETSGYLII